MRTPETEQLLRELLRTNQAIGIGEIHTQLACRQFMIEHMDIFAEEGVKYLSTEALVHPDHAEIYQGLNYPDTERQLKLADMKSAIATRYPDMSHDDTRDLAMDWCERHPAIQSEQMAELDKIYAAYTQYDYSFSKLAAKAERYGIKVVGLNVSDSNNRFPLMHAEAERFYNDYKQDGKIVFHTGCSHLLNADGEPEGICTKLEIPAIGVFDGPQATPQIIKDGLMQFVEVQDELPVQHHYVIQGQRAPVKDADAVYPEGFTSLIEVVDPHSNTHIPSTLYGAVPAKPEVLEAHTAGVGGVAEHAQKALSDKQGPSEGLNL